MTIKILLVLCVIFIPALGIADDLVKGHLKDTDRDGIKDTWIDPYFRTTPNSNPFYNYTTKPNINPYTGKKGYKDSYKDIYEYRPKSYKGYKKRW